MTPDGTFLNCWL